MNIVQKLSLNKHPKDVPDLSLVMAQNIKISNDESCITNEEGIRENTYIKIFLENHYNKSYKILGIIPCNNELIIIASAIDDISSASIFRYRENTAVTSENIKCVYTKLKYHGGKYTGTFTYNVEESLILALSEYDAEEENIPLKVINLGNYDDNNILNDSHLNDEQLSLVPEVIIPNFEYNYIKGRAYKGIYYLFIRYKINSVDYTQWYNFGEPIYIDEFTIKNIFKEHYYQAGTDAIHDQVVGASDAFSNDTDIVNKTFRIWINNIDTRYSSYQLGFICSTKSYTKSWRTNDININNIDYTLNNNIIEHSIIDFTSTYYNYYNVKNLINYKNRLYISNYIEDVIDSDIDKMLSDAAQTVKIDLYREDYTEQWLDSIKSSYNDLRINKNIKNRTLLPNGVYNFFIHFIDKYGHATKGYKINPAKPIIVENSSDYFISIPFTLENENYYCIVPANLKFVDLINYINNNLLVASGFVNKVPVLVDKNVNSVESALLDAYGEFITHNSLGNVYISQLFNSGKIVSGNINDTKLTCSFGVCMNSNNEPLWQVPNIGLTYNSSENIFTDYKIGHRYFIEVRLFDIPEGYAGYYISYEKYETNNIVTGYLTRRNANIVSAKNESGDIIIPNNNIIEESYSDELSEETMCFYSSTFDINDSIKLNYNLIELNSVSKRVPSSLGISLKEGHEINNPINANYHYIGTEDLYTNNRYPIGNYELCVANDSVNNRSFLGTCLLIEDNKKLFSDNIDENEITTYIATLYNYSNDIYTNTNKTLIRLSDYIYDSEKHTLTAYNGNITYEGIIIYNDNGYIANTTTDTNTYKSVTFKNGTYQYLPDTGNLYDKTFGISYVTFHIYSDIIFESKVFNKKPVIGYNFVDDITKEEATKATSNIVEPINSIDLFKNPQGSISDFYPITNTNYREDLVNVTQFDKTVRRSNIIQDETRVNAWRQFPIEGYKNITENKGKITNLVGIGSLFLVHTEHSLFMFDTGNTLEAIDQSIQLAQPDAFEVAYKEVFTSDLGFGGLQDKESAIIDQFGYIFYNNDSNRLYQFDNKQLAMIDDDIVEWLLKNKPYNVRFANDKQNNRLLIKFEYGDNQYSVLSYNYNIKSFISTHSYYFDKAYNTKINLYLRCDDNHNNCSLHQFIKNKNNYCSFDNVKSNLGIVINQDSKLSIIINPSFEIIKYLEYFNYKLSKIADVDKVSFTNLPVEGTITPFAGNKLKVYNDLTNTGELDINVNEETAKNIFANFDKPYWHLGVWNYSYLRNKINIYPSTKNPDTLSRIIGNYFIIEFTFDNSDNKLIEFEGLNYKVIR